MVAIAERKKSQIFWLMKVSHNEYQQLPMQINKAVYTAEVSPSRPKK